ncbi:MAG: BON domain-containing protein [Spirochaetales bacterium]|nr:BON domain-containing protein [Spirochaetales bacterium]
MDLIKYRMAIVNNDKKETENLRRELIEAIQQDADITDATNISVNVTGKKATGTISIELFGKVNNETDKDRAGEIVEKKVEDNATVENNITIDPGFQTP